MLAIKVRLTSGISFNPELRTRLGLIGLSTRDSASTHKNDLDI